MLVVPLVSRSSVLVIRLSQQGDVWPVVFPSHLVKANIRSNSILNKQSLKELGISFVRALLGPFRTNSFSLIYQINWSPTSISTYKTLQKQLFFHCSLLKGPLIVYESTSPCLEEEQRPPPQEVPRDGLESRRQGGWVENLQEEDDHHFHCRWHPAWTAVCQSSCCRG